MPLSQPFVDYLGIMNRYDQPIAIVPDIEDYKTIHAVRIGEAGSQLLKVSPARRPHDSGPGTDLRSCFPIVL